MDIEILKEVNAKEMVSASVRQQQIAFVCQRGRSVRRACALEVARSTIGYESKLAQRDAPAVAVMQELKAQYPRYVPPHPGVHGPPQPR